MAPENKDIQSHERTYQGMMAVAKWSSIAIATIVALVLWLIAS